MLGRNGEFVICEAMKPGPEAFYLQKLGEGGCGGEDK